LFSKFSLEGAAPRVDFKAAIANANRISPYANEVRHLTAGVRETGMKWSTTQGLHVSSAVWRSRNCRRESQ